MENKLTYEIIELRNEPDKRTGKPVQKVFLVKLKFDPERYQMQFPCLNCGAKGHKFQVFKDNVFQYCPKTMVTLKTSTYQNDGSTFLKHLEIVSEKQISKSEALAYLKINRITAYPDVALAIMG